MRGGPGLRPVLHRLLWGWFQAEPFEVGGEKAGGGRAAYFLFLIPHNFFLEKGHLWGATGEGGLQDGLAAAPLAVASERVGG